MRTMLVVIECAPIRRALARIVEREGWYVVEADPRRADALLGDVSFDVVLCDWFLSTRTAEAMLTRLQEKAYVGRVIVMSSDADDARLHQCCARNGFQLLPKPFGLAALRRALRDVGARPTAAEVEATGVHATIEDDDGPISEASSF